MTRDLRLSLIGLAVAGAFFVFVLMQ